MEKEREDYHSLKRKDGYCSIDNTFCERQGPCAGCPTNNQPVTFEEQKQKIIEILNDKDMVDNDREIIFDEIKAKFCIECGSKDPTCQCWNDE